MCGLFAISNSPDAAKLTYLGLFALQHRGQESCGIVSVENNGIHSHRGRGLVSDVFDEVILQNFFGHAAIGHVRYSTAGGCDPSNTQPLSLKSSALRLALAHNGNIVNAEKLKAELENAGAIFQSSADTELILHGIARSKAYTLHEKLNEACQKLVGAFSLVTLTAETLVAAVDPMGFRPLVLGELESHNSTLCWVVASESCAFDLIGARFVRDIAPGEILNIDRKTGTLDSYNFSTRVKQGALCSFEQIYFARPDSRVWGDSSLLVREEMGAALSAELPVEADVVIAVPDSGVPMAMGYAKATSIPFAQGFIRNHYVGRTFIQPSQKARNFGVRLKLNPVREVVAGKKIVVVDDSIVRGTTSRKIVELLREAGAREIHLRIASPAVRYSCYFGIDTPERHDLLAQKMTFKEMQEFLKVDSLAFLSLSALSRILGRDHCFACFNGRYPDALSQNIGNPEYTTSDYQQREAHI